MRIRFVKMHGAGNDFVLLENMSRALRLEPERVRSLADRRHGIGCDQVLVAEPAGTSHGDVRLRMFNADGREVGQCGNGARCFAVFVRERGIVDASCMAIEAGDRVLDARILGDGRVTVDMGVPLLEPRDIPFLADERAPSYALEVDGEDLQIGAVSMGNPHAVLRVDDVEAAPVEALGRAVQSSPRFPEGVNVGFVQMSERGVVRLRVFERGVGETLACGSGACAAVVVGGVQGWLDADVEVRLPGGALGVSWGGEGCPVWLSGPTARVFDGEIEL